MNSHASKDEPTLRRRPGRPPRISRDAIAAAALEIGLDNVTVTSVAAHLGVDHSSLYRHVSGRDEIVSDAAGLAIAQLDWRHDDQGWRHYLEAMTDAMWVMFERHPGLADALRALQVMPMPGLIAFAEATERLQAFGFSLQTATLAVETLVDLTGDCFMGWRMIKSGPVGEAPRLDGMVAAWEGARDGAPQYSQQVDYVIDVMRGEPRDWWTRKRDLVLDGIAMSLERESA